MAGTFFKWLIPGVVTIVGGTILAIAQTGAAVTDDLGVRSRAALDPTELSWATVTVDGRDVVLSGTATTQASIDDAISRIGAVRGVRAVDSQVALAEFISPFPFAATLKDGKLTLTGAYPDELVHTALLSTAGEPVDQTRLYSGAPEGFESAAKFALSALSQLDEGEARLADLDLRITGRAKSTAAFDSLQTLPQSAPSGLHLAAMTITPPVAAPFKWTASFDGTKVTVSGDSPAVDLGDKLRALSPANVPVSTTLDLASGAPPGFADNTLILLSSLLSLERGDASIEDGDITLSGAPATSAVADEVRAAITKIGGTVTLEPPRVADYATSIDKSAGSLVFGGFVPDAATRDRLGALPGADVGKLQLGRGETERFASALVFGLGVLDHLGEGRFEIKGDRISVGGRAATIADFKSATGLLAEGAPQGLSLAAAVIHPPLASPFTWSAAKDASGKITLTGYVPDDAARQSLAGKAADLAADKTDPADGAPKNFVLYAGKGLDVLALLDTGAVVFDGTSWSIEGTVSDTKKSFAADAAYSVAGLRTAGFTYSVHLPEGPAVAALPTITPYVWRAQKTADGNVSFSGFAPAEAFQRVAKGRVPGVADATTLAAGAPSDFGTTALAGLDALQGLSEGTLALNGTRWTLTGVAGDSAARETVQNRLTANINAANWQIAIQAKDASPIVTPYLWVATKSADGSLALEGYVPNAEARSIVAMAASAVTDETTIASGEPAGFADDIAAGLDALTHLSSGKAAFDGSRWTLTGNVATTVDGDLAVAALQKGSRGGALWSSSINGYPPVPSSSEAPASSSSEASSSAAPPSSEPASAESSASSEEMTREAPSTEASSSEQYPASAFMEPKAETSSVEASSSEPMPATSLTTVEPMPATLVFEATRPLSGPMVLKGSVPAHAAAVYFGGVAGDVSTDDLKVVSGLPADFITNAVAGIDALTHLTGGHLGFDGKRWWLRGKADSTATGNAVTSAIAALANGADWSVSVELLAPIEICTATVGEISDRNAIAFQSGKAVLMPTSLPILDELAKDLGVCPDAFVHVQAHTDGDGDADANLALSVSRAEAIVAELEKRGIDEMRLYAEGYGESAPLAPNDTKDNKAKNRRIVFAVTKE